MAISLQLPSLVLVPEVYGYLKLISSFYPHGSRILRVLISHESLHALALCFWSVIEVAYEVYEKLVPRKERGLDWKLLRSTRLLGTSRAFVSGLILQCELRHHLGKAPLSASV